MTEKIKTYESDDIVVSYSVIRCIHAEECIRRLPRVFNPKQRPWIAPQNASAEEIVDTILNCPSGALHFERKDGGVREAVPEQNTVTVDPDGPLYVRGDLEITTPDGETVVMKETRVALCRCGVSKNKPVCDNSHQEIHFTDPARVTLKEGWTSEGENTGTLRITPTENGPFLLRGKVKIQGSQVVFREKAWLCRCGGSQNKPFCDGTHAKIGFQSTAGSST